MTVQSDFQIRDNRDNRSEFQRFTVVHFDIDRRGLVRGCVYILIQSDGLSSDIRSICIISKGDLNLVGLRRIPGFFDGILGGSVLSDLEVDHMDACFNISILGCIGSNVFAVNLQSISSYIFRLEDSEHCAVVHITQIFARKSIDYAFRRDFIGHVSGSDDPIFV